MKRFPVNVLFSFSAAVFLSACGKPGTDTPGRAQTSTQPQTVAIKGSPAFTDFAVPPKPEVTSDLLARGKSVFAVNCVACHGVKGDGNGDAAAFLAPKPRDFVKANYRLRTTAPNNLPTDVDLFREISLGVPGTPMPPWRYMLADNDRWALVEYVKSLSPRFADASEVRTAIADFGTPPVKNVTTIAEGKALYAKLNCFSCHGESGHGDGQAAAALVDDSGGRIKPRDSQIQSYLKADTPRRKLSEPSSRV